MSAQVEMFSSMITRKIAVYGGYSWSYSSILAAAGYADRISGVVVTPRWMDRFTRESDAEGIAHRVIIDNGAYPAWVNGEVMGFGEQLDGIHHAMTARPDAEWIIAPDVVGDADRTWARLNACALELETYGLHRLLLPLQDGMDVARVVRLADAYSCGIFVGGSTWRYKVEALRELQGCNTRWVHVGRASSWAQLEAAASLGADAVDSTSFVRRYDHNVGKQQHYKQALDKWAHPRQSSPRASSPRELSLADACSYR